MEGDRRAGVVLNAVPIVPTALDDPLYHADLPLHFDDVTPQWLGRALGTAFPGVQVASAERDRDRFGTAASARFELTYAERAGHADLPASVYVKGGFDDKWRRRVWQALHQEVRFYGELAAQVPVNLAQCWFQGLNDAPQGVLVMEDITRRGVRFGMNLARVSADDVASVLEQAALMHARWWGSPKLDRLAGWGEPQRVYLRWSFRPKFWDELAARPHGELLVRALRDSPTALRALHRLWDIMDAQPKTLLHGDLHGGNVFYERDGRAGFLDWQLVFAGCWAHDMSWIITTALDVEQRRAHEADLIRHYLSALRAHRGEAPSFDEAWLLHRQNAVHAAVSYGAAPADADKPDIVNGAALRGFQAAVDHDVLDALGLRNG